MAKREFDRSIRWYRDKIFETHCQKQNRECSPKWKFAVKFATRERERGERGKKGSPNFNRFPKISRKYFKFSKMWVKQLHRFFYTRHYFPRRRIKNDFWNDAGTFAGLRYRHDLSTVVFRLITYREKKRPVYCLRTTRQTFSISYDGIRYLSFVNNWRLNNAVVRPGEISTPISECSELSLQKSTNPNQE